MPASYEKIILKENESFSIGVFQDNIEKSTWHFHHKLELTFVTEGSGKRIVGDSIEHFSPGDLIFIGEKLPHIWIAEKDNVAHPTSRTFESVYLQFGSDIMPAEILKLPELSNVAKAIKLSERGIRITGDTLNKVSKLMLELPYINGFDRLVYFYQIMNYIGESNSNVLLTSESYIKKQFKSKSRRITKIHEYLMSNYQQDINLDDIANLIHMVSGSVCRFFKSQMGISIFDYLNKIKVEYACTMLLDNDTSISDIAYDCGFNNLSHFNRQFKKVMDSTPSAYRKQYKIIT